MRLIHRALEFLAPDTCLGCGKERNKLCDDCAGLLGYPEHCIICRKPSMGGLTCSKCQKQTPITALFVKSEYKGFGKDLITYMKYHPSPSTARLLGELVSETLPYLEAEEVIVSHIPTTPGRVRERGFDQAKTMAGGIASSRHWNTASLLRRLSKSHQVGSGRRERIEHMEGAFTTKNPHLVHGKTIILVDDVLTTGATLDSAARELKKAGAKKVLAAVFARAE